MLGKKTCHKLLNLLILGLYYTNKAKRPFSRSARNVIRRFTQNRPALVVAFVLLWTFHFSFGMFTHYHPEYVHAHDGELQAHQHGGHFHSLELDTLARFIDSGMSPLRPGDTHHHSESLPGSDAESVQYDFNSSGITKVVQLAVTFHPVATPENIVSVEPKILKSLLISSDTSRLLLLPQSFIERSPPLRV